MRKLKIISLLNESKSYKKRNHQFRIYANRFFKKMSESILEDILSDIVKNLKKHKVVKISNFGTFHIRFKKRRVGRNPKTKEEKIIKERNVVLFKPSKDFKKFINDNEKKLESL